MAGGLDPFTTFEMFSAQVGLARPEMSAVAKMALTAPAAAWKYMMAPRWDFWFPRNAVVPDCPPTVISSMTAVEARGKGS